MPEMSVDVLVSWWILKTLLLSVPGHWFVKIECKMLLKDLLLFLEAVSSLNCDNLLLLEANLLIVVIGRSIIKFGIS